MKTIKISDVLAMIEAGDTRKEIQQKLDITTTDLTNLFKHPALKGKRQRKKSGIIIVNDLEGTVDAAQTPTPEVVNENHTTDDSANTVEIPTETEDLGTVDGPATDSPTETEVAEDWEN